MESSPFRTFSFLPDIKTNEPAFILYFLSIISAILVGYSQYRKRNEGE